MQKLASSTKKPNFVQANRALKSAMSARTEQPISQSFANQSIAKQLKKDRIPTAAKAVKTKKTAITSRKKVVAPANLT
mgnify:CR=1 FL=1